MGINAPTGAEPGARSRIRGGPGAGCRDARGVPALDHRYPAPVVEGVLVRRYQRFLADVEVSGGEVLTVHCANSGSMRTCAEPGRPVRISDSGSATRRLRWNLEQIRMGRAWVGLNTAVPNRALEAAVARGGVEALRGYPSVRREVVYGRERRSRIDLLLEDGPRRCWVEIKNTSYRVGDEVRFPDSPTERGRKHLDELVDRARVGDRAVLVFFVNRPDVRLFRPAYEIDPAYAEGLARAAAAGVEVLPLRALLSSRGVTVGAPIPYRLEPAPDPADGATGRGNS